MNYSKILLTAGLTFFVVSVPFNAVFATEKTNIQVGMNEATQKKDRIIMNNELTKIYTGETFIDEISQASMKLGADYGIYASVMIAQAVLESNFGKSVLSQNPNNNLFGIKGKYKGSTSTFSTLEDSGAGELFRIKSKFRVYENYNQSLEDYAQLIKYGLKYNQNYYAGAWKNNTESYMNATAYLEGRYATDSSYANKLNHLIDKYDLTRFDVEQAAYFVADRTIIVKEGDTLQKLALANKVTVEDLKVWNELATDQIDIGQELIVTIKEIKAIPTIKKQVSTESSPEAAANKQEDQSEKVEEVKVNAEAQQKALNLENEKEEELTQTKKIIKKTEKPEVIVKEIKEKKKEKKVILTKQPKKKEKKEIVYKPTKYYTVMEGDSITSISSIHNITSDQLKKWNVMKNASLKIGERLIVDVEGSKKNENQQTTNQTRYMIQSGDSLASVATRFNTTEQRLVKLNNLDSIFVYDGQVIIINK